MIFNKTYFGFTLFLLTIEILIGKYPRGTIIRPYGGDFFVVILIYCFVKCFLNKTALSTAFGVLLFAYAVEISQYFHLISWMGLIHSKMAALLLGTSFSWTDMLCYTLGIGLVFTIEKTRTTITYR